MHNALRSDGKSASMLCSRGNAHSAQTPASEDTYTNAKLQFNALSNSALQLGGVNIQASALPFECLIKPDTEAGIPR